MLFDGVVYRRACRAFGSDFAGKKSETAAPEHFEADAPILIPDAPQIEKDYYPSRITENQWQKDEVDKWFTYPDEDVMKDLAESNDKIVKDIIGAAP